MSVREVKRRRKVGDKIEDTIKVTDRRTRAEAK